MCVEGFIEMNPAAAAVLLSNSVCMSDFLSGLHYLGSCSGYLIKSIF